MYSSYVIVLTSLALNIISAQWLVMIFNSVAIGIEELNLLGPHELIIQAAPTTEALTLAFTLGLLVPAAPRASHGNHGTLAAGDDVSDEYTHL